jgi:hypothetical protein
MSQPSLAPTPADHDVCFHTQRREISQVNEYSFVRFEIFTAVRMMIDFVLGFGAVYTRQ